MGYDDSSKLYKSDFANALYDATVWQVFGDSISTTYGISEAQIWHNVITADAEFAHLTKYNSAASGSEVSDGGRADVLSFIERYNQLNASADLVTIFAGVNDWAHNNIPLGNYNDATTQDSLYGALNTLLPGIRTQCPDARIIWMSPLKTKSNKAVESTNANGTNAFGLYLTDYINAIKEKCGQYDIEFVDMYGVSGLDPDVDTDNFQLDGLHPTAAGHVAIKNYLLNNATVYVPAAGTGGEVLSKTVSVNAYHGNHYNLMYAIDATGLEVGDVVKVEWKNKNVTNFGGFNSSTSFFAMRPESGARTSINDECSLACDIVQTGNWTQGSSTSTITTANTSKYPLFLAMTSFIPSSVASPTTWEIEELHIYVNDVEVPIFGMGGFFTDEANIDIDFDFRNNFVKEYSNVVSVNAFHSGHYNLCYTIDAEGIELGDVIRVSWRNSDVTNVAGFNTSESFFAAFGTCGVRTSVTDNCSSAGQYIVQAGNWTEGTSTTDVKIANSHNYPYLLVMTSFSATNTSVPATWKVEDFHVYVNEVEVPVLNMGGFFTDESNIDIDFDYRNNFIE